MDFTDLIINDSVTGKEVLSFPLNFEETDLTDNHRVNLLSKDDLTIECDNAFINYTLLSDLAGIPDMSNINAVIFIQARRHKKKRINKKWAKRYGFKFIIKDFKGWKGWFV